MLYNFSPTPAIYTDGSRHHSKVGYAAYALDRPEVAKTAYIGLVTRHNVYVGEVAALALAL